jgi:hypothetical protein
MITKNYEWQQNEVLNRLFADFEVPAKDLMYMKPYRNIILNPIPGSWALLEKGAKYELLTSLKGNGGGGCSTSFAKNMVKIYRNTIGVLMMRYRSYGDWRFTELIVLNKEENLNNKDYLPCMSDGLHDKHKVVDFK